MRILTILRFWRFAFTVTHTAKRARGQGRGGSPYDPFRLIPFSKATGEPPYRICIHTAALLLMDVHAHLTHHEVIGLLGGRFDSHARILNVEKSWPCNSNSTGLQCEVREHDVRCDPSDCNNVLFAQMDPASELEAREEFQRRGLEVVGWYHSHPTFRAHPSVRDIENQVNYQVCSINMPTPHLPPMQIFTGCLSFE